MLCLLCAAKCPMSVVSLETSVLKAHVTPGDGRKTLRRQKERPVPVLQRWAKRTLQSALSTELLASLTQSSAVCVVLTSLELVTLQSVLP